MQVDCVTSGQQAINRIREKKSVYDAVFMDHMMPEMDGIETARHIRAIGTEYAQKIPIIALTANAIIGNEKMFLENGFQAFLTKPIDVMRLDAVIRQWVRNKEREKSCADNPPTPEARPEFGLPAIEGLDAQACLTRFGGDSRVYASVLRSYAVNTAPLLEQLRAVTESGLPEYAIAVHGIKGSSRGVGAGAIGEQAEELELAAKAGDIAFVRRHNESFIAAAQSLLRAVNAALDTGVAEDKPVREAPDRGLLDELTEHCTNYDMDGIDEVMEKLDGFIYEKQADLVAWLQERVALMEFTEISDRLREAS
ncbi:MAG: response regulator, partial [Gracilibacteraceae bacterium]|jgi:CheY-like chemotaxis protein|nr:response regulator [Gracilibacteraceae bacterium]